MIRSHQEDKKSTEQNELYNKKQSNISIIDLSYLGKVRKHFMAIGEGF